MKNLIYPIALMAIFLFSCSSDSEPKDEPDIVSPTIDFSIAGIDNNTSQTTIPVVSNEIEINIDAKDEGGISKIEAFINDDKVGEDLSAPYKIIIDISSYSSKAASTNKYQNYTLKIIATDKSGNSSSKEQEIAIDNEIPSITEVSLQEDNVINGSTNTLTFSASDNEAISTVNVYINDDLIATIDDGNYELNIDTSLLTDGENVLKIEATDPASNTGTHRVKFISDNTGPEISIESIVENQIIDELIQLNPKVTDEFSEISSLEILLGESSLSLFENVNEFSLDFNPNLFPVGQNSIILVASDSLGNKSKKTISIQLYRRLLVINLAQQNFDFGLIGFFVFASTLNGELLAVEEISQDAESIILRTSEDINEETEYMLTFAEYRFANEGYTNELTTISNLKSSIFNTMNLKPRSRGQQNSIAMNPSWFTVEDIFNTSDIISLSGSGFDYTAYEQTPNGILINRYKNETTDKQSNNIYLSKKNYEQNSYEYLLLNWNEIPVDLKITPSLFSSDGVEKPSFSAITNNGESLDLVGIRSVGYLNEDDFMNNIYHRIDIKGYYISSATTFEYYRNDIFSNHLFGIQLNDYYTERSGSYLGDITMNDWTIDYTFANNTFEIISNGNGHSVGKVFISDYYGHPDENLSQGYFNGSTSKYRWSIIFDSAKTDLLTLPQIPDKIQSREFYQLFDNQYLQVQQVEIKGYEGIPSYQDYLREIIKDNNFSHVKSPIMESKFTPTEAYQKTRNFILD